MKLSWFSVLICFLQLGGSTDTLAQSMGFEMPVGQQKLDIPFEYTNKIIVVKVRFNRTLQLKFVFDTGAEHTILTKREISDLLGLKYGRSFSVMGADFQKELTAYVLPQVRLEAGEAQAIDQNILVLDEDYFRFEEYTGVEIHGIMGADLFRRYVVKINYQRQVISLYNPSKYSPPSPKKYQTLPLTMHKSKPYLQCPVFLQSRDSVMCRLLLDTGASLAVLLNTSSHPKLQLPPTVLPSNIGAGLGGFLKGYVGRVAGVRVGDVALNNVLTNFQKDDSLKVRQDSLVFRNGILGNDLLSRFIMVIDYEQSVLYLRPTRAVSKKFVYDKSGLTLITTGIYNNHLIVQNVLPDSPAAQAGLAKGDVVRRINGIPAIFLSLQAAQRILRTKAGKRIRIKVKRMGYPLKRKFVLRDLL